MTRLSCCLLTVLSLAATASPAPKLVDAVGVTEAVAASDGTVWARRSNGQLAWFTDGAWKPAAEHPGSSLEAIAADAKRGGVVSLWTTGKTWELWRTWKQEAGRLATSELPLPSKPRLFTTGEGSVWVLGESRRLLEVSRDGKVQQHVLDASWLVMPEHSKAPQCSGLRADGCCETPTREEVYCGAVQAFEAAGALWFWSKGSSNSFVLPGVLGFRAGKMTPWTEPGLPSAVTRAVLPAESSVLLSAKGQVFRLDLRARSVAPEPFPPLTEQTPQDVLAFFQSGEATWALVSRSFQQLEGKLLRRPKGGTFEVTLPGVGGLVYLFMKAPAFAWAKGPGGREHAWLAARGGAPWRLGPGAPEQLDWSRGVPFTEITGLFLLAGDQLLITDASAGTLVMPAWSSGPPEPPLLKRFPVKGRAITWTADGRLWWLEEKDPLRLHEWTGNAAQEHGEALVGAPTPSGSTLFVDSKQVLWVVPEPSRGFPDEGPPVVLFDTASAKGRVLGSYVAAARERGDVRSVSGLDTGALPAVQADGTFCFSDPKRAVSCVDAKGAWRRWTPEQISGRAGASLWSSPTLGKDGAVTVLVNHLGKNVRWARSGETWKVVEGSEPPSVPAAPVPSKCEPATPAIEGQDGRRWFSTREQLMVNRGSVCRARLPGVALPSMQHVRFDAKRHDALIFGDQLVVLQDDDAFPETKLGAPKTQLDTLRVPVKGAEGVAEASVDGGPWLTVELENGVLVLEGLRRGKRRIEVRAASAHLRVDPTPAELVVEIAFVDQALLETLLAEVVRPGASVDRLAPRFRLVAGLAVKRLEQLRVDPRQAANAGVFERLLAELKTAL